MKYCFNYNSFTENSKYIHEIEEWTIEYNEKDNTLLEFLEKNKNKTINLYINNNINFDFLQELCNKYSNLIIKFNFYIYNDIILKNKPKFNFYFDLKVNDWDTFIGLINMGVSSIYIVENLGFDLENISKIAKKNNVKLRVYPNVAQSTWNNINDLKKFFIRPEDIDIYEQYIDIVEFFEVDKKIDIYYNIYKNKKVWNGKLKEIILNFNSDINNQYIDLNINFANTRVKCNKKCFKGKKCIRCDNIIKLSKTLEENQLLIQIKKEKENNIWPQKEQN